jgi:hypothetical protein
LEEDDRDGITNGSTLCAADRFRDEVEGAKCGGVGDRAEEFARLKEFILVVHG